MSRFLLCLLSVSLLVISCGKNVKPPVSYSVTDDANDSTMEDIYIPDSGSASIPVLVKFLTGYQAQGDNVTLAFSGLPANVTVIPGTFSAIPTYTENFVFTGTNATQGTYPITLTASTAYGYVQPYYLNVHVIPADCAASFFGNITGSSACSSRNYTHTATGSTGGTNVLVVNNFGGYGNNCNVTVVLNCDNNTLSIAKANYGNGVVLQGTGTFTGNTMTISYTAFTIPGGGTEVCTLTYTK